MAIAKWSTSTASKVWTILPLVLWILLPLNGNAKTLPVGPKDRDLEVTSSLDRADTLVGRRYIIDDDDVTDDDADGGDGSEVALLNSPLWTAMTARREQTVNDDTGYRMVRRDIGATNGGREGEDMGCGRHYTSSDDFMTSPDYYGVVFTLKRKFPGVDLANIERAVWIVAKTSPTDELRRPDYPRRLVSKVEDRMNYPRNNETTASSDDCTEFLDAVDVMLRRSAWMRFLYTINTRYPLDSQKKLVRVYLADVISTSTIQELRQANYTDLLLNKIDGLINSGGDNADTPGVTSSTVNSQSKRDLAMTDLEDERFKFLHRRMDQPRSGIVDEDGDFKSMHNFNLHM